MTDAIANDTRKADFYSDCSRFGNEAKHGADALPKLAMRIVQAAAANVIDDTQDSEGVDDFQRAYDKYATAESNKPIHEHTVNGLKSNRSKCRQIGRAAMITAYEPEPVFEDAVEVRNDMANEDGTRVYSAFPALVQVAREMLKSDTALATDELREAMRKPDPKDKTVEDEVTRAMKILADLITGENKSGLECQDEDIVKAHEYGSTFLAKLVGQRELDELHARAAELGVTIADGDTHPTSEDVKEAKLIKKADK